MSYLFVLASLLVACGPSQEEIDRQALTDQALITLAERVASLEAVDPSFATKDDLKVSDDARRDLDRRLEELETVGGIVCEEYAAAHPVPADFNWRHAMLSEVWDNADPTPPIPTAFEAFATDKVLRAAVTPDFREANEYAREAAFDQLAEQAGIDDAEKVGQYSTWTAAVLDVARQYLKDPARLWATYQKFKPAALEAIKATGEAVKIKAELEQVAPVFTTPLDLEKEKKNREQSRFDRLAVYYGTDADADFCADYFSDKADEWSQEDGVVNYVAHWMLRRQDEGGRALVLTWGSIFNDLARSIEVPPASQAPAAKDGPPPAPATAQSAATDAKPQ